MKGQQQQQQKKTTSRITTTFIVEEGSVSILYKEILSILQWTIFNSKLYKGHEQVDHRRKITSDNENVHFTCNIKTQIKAT